MNVNIGEIHSTVNAVDSEALLSPRVMRQIVSTVLQALAEHEAHQQRLRSERRITAGVADELEEAAY